MKISEAIFALRQKLCLEQKEFGELIGVSCSSISCYEHGQRNPSKPVIRKLMELFKKHKLQFTMEDFLGD